MVRGTQIISLLFSISILCRKTVQKTTMRRQCVVRSSQTRSARPRLKNILRVACKRLDEAYGYYYYSSVFLFLFFKLFVIVHVLTKRVRMYMYIKFSVS